MKAFGYGEKKLSEDGLLQMAEVTFAGTSASIREIGQFLLKAAEEMERMGSRYDHLHIKYASKTGRKKWPEVIVAKNRK
jgi:hypothetical protein